MWRACASRLVFGTHTHTDRGGGGLKGCSELPAAAQQLKPVNIDELQHVAGGENTILDEIRRTFSACAA